MPTRSTSELQRIAARARLDAIQMVSIQGSATWDRRSRRQKSSPRFSPAASCARVATTSPSLPATTSSVFMRRPRRSAEYRGKALASYGLDGATLEAIGEERTPVVDMVCGSLGQGLSVAIGYALAAGLAGEDRRSFAFLSDGELQEGQIWEAAMFAAHNHDRMGRLVAVIDANNSQVDGP